MVSSRPSLSSSISNLQFPWFSGTSGFYIFTTSNQTFTPESELALIWSNWIYAEPQANHWITCGLLGAAHTQTTWKENAQGVDRYRTKGVVNKKDKWRFCREEALKSTAKEKSRRSRTCDRVRTRMFTPVFSLSQPLWRILQGWRAPNHHLHCLFPIFLGLQKMKENWWSTGLAM